MLAETGINMNHMNEPTPGGRRIAFFGGSFDPPHMGHIGIARAAQAALQLDTVLFAPVGMQPLKPLGSTASFEDRVAMTELAIKGLPNFCISFADAPDSSGEPNYTIDTLNRLQAQFPSAQLFTLMGADSLVSLPRWYRGAEIPFIAPLIVASRPGERLEDLSAILPEGLTIEEEQSARPREEVSLRVFTIRNPAGAATPFYLLPGLQIEISASDIRGQVSAALDRLCAGHELLPDAVCEYIAAHELYREG
jgi:nicotinate-nucleotide adenylyltransferase